jgi:hypothetical protein
VRQQTQRAERRRAVHRVAHGLTLHSFSCFFLHSSCSCNEPFSHRCTEGSRSISHDGASVLRTEIAAPSCAAVRSALALWLTVCLHPCSLHSHFGRSLHSSGLGLHSSFGLHFSFSLHSGCLWSHSYSKQKQRRAIETKEGSAVRGGDLRSEQLIKEGRARWQMRRARRMRTGSCA